MNVWCLGIFLYLYHHNIIALNFYSTCSCISAAPLEDIAEEEHQEEEEDIDIGEDDEMADFIVDEEDVDEDGVPVRYLPLCNILTKFAYKHVNL